MIRINENFLKLKASYLFSQVKDRENKFEQTRPDIKIIKLGIGDVTLPLPEACIEAFELAVREMSEATTFRGYGPENGYVFLRDAIAANDFQSRGVDIASDEVFVSDGSKCDVGNFQELFSLDCTFAVQDPVYPAYVDGNVMAGRTGDQRDGRYDKITYLDCTSENDYTPELPSQPVDLIYLCYPNNPTGAVVSKDVLKKWVDYAHTHKALILFDAAYEAFIKDDEIPHSIFEVEGARQVAVEFRSFSKTAGFTGVRCAYTVVPKECQVYDTKGEKHSLHSFWNRRHATKFNGVSYPVQKAAAAIYSEEGQKQVQDNINYYLANASLIRTAFQKLGFSCVGGDNSPYIWVDGKRDSWEMFELLLNQAGVVCTPGVGFGKCGQGHIRISAFNHRENVEEALERIQKAL